MSRKATASSTHPRTTTDRLGAVFGGQPPSLPRSALLQGTSHRAGSPTDAVPEPSASDSCSLAGLSFDRPATYHQPVAGGRAPERAASAWSVEPWGKESPRLARANPPNKEEETRGSGSAELPPECERPAEASPVRLLQAHLAHGDANVTRKGSGRQASLDTPPLQVQLQPVARPQVRVLYRFPQPPDRGQLDTVHRRAFVQG